MAVNWEAVTERISTRGPDGKWLSLVAGDESEQDLRDIIRRLTNRCPADQRHPRCPFRALSGLSYDSFISVVAPMNRQALLELFEMECECRNGTAGSVTPPPDPGSI